MTCIITGFHPRWDLSAPGTGRSFQRSRLRPADIRWIGRRLVYITHSIGSKCFKHFLRALEIKEVRKFEDHGALQHLATVGVSEIVVDEEEIAERVVDDVESDIRAHLAGVRIVLKERIQKGVGSERVKEAGSHQVRRKVPVREIHLVAPVISFHLQVKVGSPAYTAGK